jgi:Arc/MetJ-type ribon-helix-helix transcriptional regulator
VPRLPFMGLGKDRPKCAAHLPRGGETSRPAALQCGYRDAVALCAWGTVSGFPLKTSYLVLHHWHVRNTLVSMKTLTVRLPERLVAEIEAESRERQISKSDVIRERLQHASRPTQRPTAPLDAIADLIGSVDGLPDDLSTRKKHYLKATGYGRKRAP